MDPRMNGLYAQAPAYAGGGMVPASNYGAAAGGGMGPMGMAFQQANQQLWGGFPGVMQGLFGHSGRPFEKAGEAYKPYYEEAKGYQNPFYQAGQGAMGHYQDWLQSQQDPSKFINNLMGQYQESPYAKYQQQQGMRAAENMGSASGLMGSTPLTQFAQQNAQNISSQDMNQWLQNVLGINTQYGAGQAGMMQQGQQAGDYLSQLAGNAGNTMGGVAYGQEAGKQQDQNALWAGLAKMFGG